VVVAGMKRESVDPKRKKEKKELWLVGVKGEN
jgi:hypothetical protein